MGEYNRKLFEAFLNMRRLRLSGVLSGITAMELEALRTIEVCRRRDGNVKISSIVAELEVPAPGVSRMIRHLEEKGMVERQVDPGDRRNTFVTMTEEGMAAFEEGERVLKELGTRVIGRLGDEMCETLVEGVNAFVQYTEEEMEKMNEGK